MTPNPPRALHLPDLPEVSMQIGGDDARLADSAAPGAEPRLAPSRGYQLRQALLSYLPLLLMALLAASTGWLVKHTPQPPDAAVAGPPSQAPDYTMTRFSISRFAPDGREVLRIAGDVLRHFPATDQLEIEGVTIHAIAPDGRITDASARRALANGDASEVQLLGAAQVTSQIDASDRLQVQSEFLHAFLSFERLRSHLPVQVQRAGSDTRAAGLEYDHPARRLTLLGPVRATLQPGREAVASAGK